MNERPVSLAEPTRRPPGAGAEEIREVGDVLLTFGGGKAAPGRTSAPWESAAAEGSWNLRIQPVTDAWRGYPAVAFASGPWRAWMLGERYGAESGSAPPEPAALAGGQRLTRELNGHLLVLAWNDAERRWHVWTDRFGTVHAYHASDGSRAALGTGFAAVSGAASRKRLDWPGISGFFAAGFFPEDRTFFEDVRILRPASHSVFDERGTLLRSERYWDWSHTPDRRRSLRDTVEEFRETLERVLREQTASGRVALPISGGLDSRSTVAAATRAGHAPGARLWSYSYGYDDHSVETRIARRVAVARRLPFRALTVGPYLFDRLPLVLACVEGFQDVTQSRQAVVADLLRADADAVIAAHWGDVWLDDMGLAGAEGSGPDETAVVDHAMRRIVKRGRGWLLREVASPRLAGTQAEEELRAMVARELSRVSSIEDPDFRVKAFKTDQWSFRWTLASLRMFQAGAFPRLPFYDVRLADFFATVPTDLVAGRRLQIEYLKQCAPDLARITWQAYDTNLFWHRHYRTWLLPKRLLRKLWRTATRARPVERNWEVQFGSGEGRRRLERHLLRPGLRVHEHVAPEKIRALLEAFDRDPLGEGRGYTVSMLLTFSAWMESHA